MSSHTLLFSQAPRFSGLPGGWGGPAGAHHSGHCLGLLNLPDSLLYPLKLQMIAAPEDILTAISWATQVPELPSWPLPDS